jgi:hypothetical protein
MDLNHVELRLSARTTSIDLIMENMNLIALNRVQVQVAQLSQAHPRPQVQVAQLSPVHPRLQVAQHPSQLSPVHPRRQVVQHPSQLSQAHPRLQVVQHPSQLSQARPSQVHRAIAIQIVNHHFVQLNLVIEIAVANMMIRLN